MVVHIVNISFPIPLTSIISFHEVVVLVWWTTSFSSFQRCLPLHNLCGRIKRCKSDKRYYVGEEHGKEKCHHPWFWICWSPQQHPQERHFSCTMLYWLQQFWSPNWWIWQKHLIMHTTCHVLRYFKISWHFPSESMGIAKMTNTPFKINFHSELTK